MKQKQTENQGKKLLNQLSNDAILWRHYLNSSNGFNIYLAQRKNGFNMLGGFSK